MLPYIILVPCISKGGITLGSLQRLVGAFNNVERSFQFLVRNWGQILGSCQTWELKAMTFDVTFWLILLRIVDLLSVAWPKFLDSEFCKESGQGFLVWTFNLWYPAVSWIGLQKVATVQQKSGGWAAGLLVETVPRGLQMQERRDWGLEFCRLCSYNATCLKPCSKLCHVAIWQSLPPESLSIISGCWECVRRIQVSWLHEKHHERQLKD